MKIYIGYDPAEHAAYQALLNSLAEHSALQPEPLIEERLQAVGLLNRPTDKRGQMYDLTSNAPCSTEFAASRFLVPIICQSGYALFMDCDMICLTDPLEILQYIDPSKAVSVVKHKHDGRESEKMGGMLQTAYRRKNWSSVMVFNCDHAANQRLNLAHVNARPGRDMHGFFWLNDDEIGELSADWNWLVNVNPKPDNAKIAHFTLGGPWITNWTTQPHDELWLKYAGHDNRRNSRR